MRIGMLDALSGLALIFGRIIITLAVGGGAYFIFTTRYQSSMSGLIGSTVLCMLVAYVVTGVFTSVYASVVQTMIQSYITGVLYICIIRFVMNQSVNFTNGDFIIQLFP